VRYVLMLVVVAATWPDMNRGFADEPAVRVSETDAEVRITTPHLEAVINKKGYVSGVKARSLLDRRTGFRDAGFGLDIVDWIMEPGSDVAYRTKLESSENTRELIYRFGNPYHGKRPKRSIEGPQICTRARELKPEVIRGRGFVAIRQRFRYRTAAPGKKAGSTWTQLLVFPARTRYFISMDRIDSVNSSKAMFLRIDLPGHIRHQRGDTFSEVYLSYLAQTNDTGGFEGGRIPSRAFFESFAPDERFNYRRDRGRKPRRFIRAYRLRDPKTGQAGPWLAGMTLDPDVVHEAWCHQRGYVCLIEEFGGRPVKAGGFFRAAFIVGFFDSIDEMHAVYDRYRGHTGLEVNEHRWRLVK